MDETKYFGQTDMGIKIFALYRKRSTDGVIYQERWMPSTSSWETTTFLMRLLTGGDCAIEEITFKVAERAFPEAF